MLKIEIFRVVGNNYPSINDIFDNYFEVIKTSKIIKPKTYAPIKQVCDAKNFVPNKFKTNVNNRNVSILQNFYAKSKLYYSTCNFYKSNAHKAFYCKIYPTLKDRLQK